MNRKKAPGSAKKGILRVVFSRTGIILLLVVLQFGLILGAANYLKEYTPYLYGVLMLLNVIVLIWIINSEENSEFKMTWALL